MNDNACSFSDHLASKGLSGSNSLAGVWKDYADRKQQRQSLEPSSGGGEKKKPLLKCHAKGGEVWEPGPGRREMDPDQETGQSEAQLSERPKVESEAESAGRWLICG